MNNEKQLIIIGASGFGKEVAWLAYRLGRDVKGFLDDSETLQGISFLNGTVIGKVEDWDKHSECEFIVAIAAPRIRKKIVNILINNGCHNFATLVDPSANIELKYTKIGNGSVICAGTICTADVVIGEHCIINKLCSVGHDVVLENFVTLSPQVMLGGHVRICMGAEIGSASCIRQELIVNEGSMLGMGSILTKDAPANTLLVGNPASPIRILNPF